MGVVTTPCNFDIDTHKSGVVYYHSKGYDLCYPYIPKSLLLAKALRKCDIIHVKYFRCKNLNFYEKQMKIQNFAHKALNIRISPGVCLFLFFNFNLDFFID